MRKEVKMKIRKIALIAADLLLLIVLIVQISFSRKDAAKIFTISEDLTEIFIENAGESFSIVKDGEKWFLGDEKYPANQSSVDTLISSIQEIRALDNVGKSTNEALISRYELEESKSICVTAKAGDSVLRKIKLGKNSDTGVQGYAVIDDKNDIYLVSGNLRNTFDKSIDELRSKIVLGLDKPSLKSASINYANGETWTLSRSGTGENIVWSISGYDCSLDADKSKNWLESLASLTTTRWYSDQEAASLNGEKELSVELISDTSSVTLDIYKLPFDTSTEGASEKYYGKSSASPYTFELASYSVQKYLKNPEELAE